MMQLARRATSTLAFVALTPFCAMAQDAAPDPKEVVETYADIAQAGYEDSLAPALALREAVDALIADPSEETLEAARDAWIAARVPYSRPRSIASAIRSSTNGRAG